MIPTPFETERLVIRPFVDDDVARMEEIVADPDVMRYISLRGRTIAETLDVYRERYERHGYTFWAACTKDGRLLGDVGFAPYEETGEPSVGWRLAREAWGHGYATEAVRACITALFAHTEHDRVVALVDTRNERSLRTAERIGLRRVGEVDHPWHRHVLFDVMRP